MRMIKKKILKTIGGSIMGILLSILQILFYLGKSTLMLSAGGLMLMFLIICLKEWGKVYDER